MARPATKLSGDRSSRTSGFGSRWLVVVIVVLAIGLVLGGTLWVVDVTRNEPVRATLDRANAMIAPAHTAAAGAAGVDELVEAAQEYAGVARELDQELAKLATSPGRLARAAAMVITAQRDLATAGEGLTTVADDDLTGWSNARRALIDALDAHHRALVRLARVDPRRASAAALPAQYAAHVRGLVEQAALSSASGSLRRLLRRLSEATVTADVRAVAREARRTRPVVRVAARGFADGPGPQARLTWYAALHFALAKLRLLNGDHLDAWAGMRHGLVRSTRALAPPDHGLQTLSRTTIADVDRLVDRAAATLRDWERDRRRTVHRKVVALRVLGTYDAAMRDRFDRYATLRARVADFLDRVQDPTTPVGYAKARRVLSEAHRDRAALQASMNGLRVPPRVADQHRAVVRAVDRSAAAMYAGYADLRPHQHCRPRCDYRGNLAYQQLRRDLPGINAAYGEAADQWRETVTRARREARNRSLPERPVV